MMRMFHRSEKDYFEAWLVADRVTAHGLRVVSLCQDLTSRWHVYFEAPEAFGQDELDEWIESFYREKS
jgi:hypothetical protein